MVVEPNHCAECGDMIYARQRELPLPGDIGDYYDKPIQGAGDRVYCSLGCAAIKQGWVYD